MECRALKPDSRVSSALTFMGHGTRSVREMRGLIMAFESMLKELPEHLTAEDFKTTHHFQPGVYIRELFIPKDTIVTGKIHKFGHTNILSQGKITVWTEDGMKTLSASTVIQSKAGMKRVGYTHEDTVWITIHDNPKEERDIKTIESRISADTFDEAYLTSERSFQNAIDFLGCTLEEATQFSEDELDQIPDENVNIKIDASYLHGKGVFARRKILKGELIGEGRINRKRTPIGRYCNHSGDPNAVGLNLDNGNAGFVALTDIAVDEEITHDYYIYYMQTRELVEGGQLCLAQL